MTNKRKPKSSNDGKLSIRFATSTSSIGEEKNYGEDAKLPAQESLTPAKAPGQAGGPPPPAAPVRETRKHLLTLSSEDRNS